MNYIGEHIGLIRALENNDFTIPDFDSRLNHAIWGIVTESGELMDLMKKHYVYNRTLDFNEIIDELGDLLFYVFQAIDEIICDRSFEDKLELVIRRNMVKLQSRYPEGKYSHYRANFRNRKVEREVQSSTMWEHLH